MILDVANNISYKHAKRQCDFCFVLLWATQKWQDLMLFWRFENVHYSLYSDPRCCHFCVAPKQNYLILVFCIFVGNITSYIHICFLNFFETQKCDFCNSEITRAREPEISTQVHECVIYWGAVWGAEKYAMHIWLLLFCIKWFFGLQCA
jgi:hypothetical protein